MHEFGPSAAVSEYKHQLWSIMKLEFRNYNHGFRSSPQNRNTLQNQKFFGKKKAFSITCYGSDPVTFLLMLVSIVTVFCEEKIEMWEANNIHRPHVTINDNERKEITKPHMDLNLCVTYIYKKWNIFYNAVFPCSC